MKSIANLFISNTFVNELPADSVYSNITRQVENACYSFVNPIKPSNPKLVCTSKEVALLLGIEDTSSSEFLNIVSGAKNISQATPYAMNYGGHQFGQWAGQLGDGRAINIAETLIKNQKWVLQLKGAGPTPYSRKGDGMAVLRSSIREFLCSEAMFHLGIPTTRALSIVETGDSILRDILYNGNAKYEKGAIVCRVAPSFIRFGNFELFASRQDTETLKKLTDYTIHNFYTHLGNPSKQTYLSLFEEVMNKSIEMIVHWQRVGFVHGVMNTDNMSILGLTIDYGPYGWVENFDLDWTPNITDAQGKRYRFGNQPSIVYWNLVRFANALYPLILDSEGLTKIINTFEERFLKSYYSMMFKKLGLDYLDVDYRVFIEELIENLQRSKIDMTIFFRSLTKFDSENPSYFFTEIKSASYISDEEISCHEEYWRSWLFKYSEKLKSENLDFKSRIESMNKINPKYVLRNYMAQMAIEKAETGDYTLVEELHQLLKNPYSEQFEHQHWFKKRPAWAENKPGCSMLSCSS